MVLCFPCLSRRGEACNPLHRLDGIGCFALWREERDLRIGRRCEGSHEWVDDVATLRFLPPSVPALNPIDKLFSTLKALLRKAAHSPVDVLWAALGTLRDTFSPTACRNYFQSSG